MQIFRQLIESLKMELGIIKVNSVQEPFTPTVKNLPVTITINENWSPFCCFIKELRLPERDLSIKSLEESQHNVQIGSLDCMKTVSVSEGTIHPKISRPRLYQMESFQCLVKSQVLHFADLGSGQQNPIRVQIKEKNLPVLRVMRLKPSPFPKTDTVLRALEIFLMRYKQNLEKLEFVGYYRSVPIGSAKRYMIMDKDLVLELSQKKSKRTDIFVFKSANDYLFQVVSRK